MSVPSQYHTKEAFKDFIQKHDPDNLILVDMLDYFDDLSPRERLKEAHYAAITWDDSLVDKDRSERNIAIFETKQRILRHNKEQEQRIIDIRKDKERAKSIKAFIPVILFSIILFILFLSV